jgi:hypothetical protein
MKVYEIIAPHARVPNSMALATELGVSKNDIEDAFDGFGWKATLCALTVLPTVHRFFCFPHTGGITVT